MVGLDSIEDIRQRMIQVEQATGNWPTRLKLSRKAFVMLANETDPPMTKAEIGVALGIVIEVVE